MTTTTTKTKQTAAERINIWTRFLTHAQADDVVARIVDNLDGCQCGCEGDDCKVEVFKEAADLANMNKDMDAHTALITVYTRHRVGGNA